jgi:hypothetical protein
MNDRLKKKLHALDCAMAYDQYFEGVGLTTETQRIEAQCRYENACRRSYEYRFGRAPVGLRETPNDTP